MSKSSCTPNDQPRVDLSKVMGVVVEVECDFCKGKGRIPGGQIKFGEVVDCPCCQGRKGTRKTISLDQFKRLFGKRQSDSTHFVSTLGDDPK